MKPTHKLVVLLFLTFFIICRNAGAQSKGFEFLSSAKSSLESIVKVYAAAIPDTSEVHRKYYMRLATNYNEAKACYDGYRGAMKDCVLGFDTKKRIQECLQKKVVNIRGSLDSLTGLVNTAYLEYYAKNPRPIDSLTYNGQNTSAITGDFVKTVLESLLAGSLKIWDQVKKFRKEYRDNYLGQITSKEYDLGNFEELLRGKASPQLEKIR